MADFAEPVERLIDQLKHLPGIGAKTAQRLAFHILRIAPEDALASAEAAIKAETARAIPLTRIIMDLHRGARVAAGFVLSVARREGRGC